MKRWIAPGLGLATVLAFMYWVLQADPSGSAPQASVSARPEAGVERSPVQARPTGALLADMQRQWATLPPPLTPLASIHDQLRRRADAGDAPAACRLGIELVRCAYALAATTDDMLAMQDAELAAVEGGSDLDSASATGTIALQQLGAAQTCVGIDRQALARTNLYLRQAAVAGIPEAAMRYADGQGLVASSNAAGNSFTGFLRSPNLATWQREAVGLVRQQLERGNPTAVLVLNMAYSSDTSMLGGLIEDDQAQARTYDILMRRVLAAKLPTRPVNGPLSAAQRASEAEAERMYRTYFGGRPVASGSMSRQLSIDSWELPPSSASCQPPVPGASRRN